MKRTLLCIKDNIIQTAPPLHTQVRELSNESLRLATSYPGANAAVITNSMEGVQSAWDSLQTSSGARKRKLRAALDLQKFLGSVSVYIT